MVSKKLSKMRINNKQQQDIEDTALAAILGGAFGAVLGGPAGAIIGAMLGAGLTQVEKDKDKIRRKI